jgi:hypothetical protein
VGKRRRLNDNTLDPKQIISPEELLMSQVIQQEALTRLLVEKGYSARRSFLRW